PGGSGAERAVQRADQGAVGVVAVQRPDHRAAEPLLADPAALALHLGAVVIGPQGGPVVDPGRPALLVAVDFVALAGQVLEHLPVLDAVLVAPRGRAGRRLEHAVPVRPGLHPGPAAAVERHARHAVGGVGPARAPVLDGDLAAEQPVLGVRVVGGDPQVGVVRGLLLPGAVVVVALHGDEVE